MLGKLMKYDIMFGARKYAFMAALTAALLIIAFAANSLNAELIAGFSIFFAIIATVVYSVMYLVISIQHLSTQLCSKESYLGYSLPVSAHSLVLSKLLCILIWGIVTTVLTIFFWTVGIGGIAMADSGYSLGQMWQEITSAMQQSGIGDSSLRSMLWMLLSIGISSSVMFVCLLGFCVSLTNVPFLKERGIGTVTGVVGFFVIPSVVYYIMGKVGELFYGNGGAAIEAFDSVFDVTIRNVGIYYTLATALVSAVIYFATVRIVEKHRFIG
ncbi:MAG: hypothetical protein FWG36_04290 [Oscillospiraceae bacterium]|nr:hypothetical protein [Oscillospiraceae bacterium]